jgi:hypothetical protein
MEKWRLMIRHDENFDLTELPDPDYVLLGVPPNNPWFKASFHIGSPATGFDSLLRHHPSDKELLDWVKAVHALRSIARRVGGYKPSKKKARVVNLTPEESDHVMADYISQMEPRLMIYPVQKGEARYRLVADAPPGVNGFALQASFIWQETFGSFLTGHIDPVCGLCGTPLPPTKTGRRSRAKFCPKCAFKDWYSSLDIEERRKQEREKKKRQRKGN